MDESSTKIISAALTMYDIMEHRVTLVEQLLKKRQPFPEMDVIYFIAPTTESVKEISKDFTLGGKAKYGSVHLFFSDTVPNRSFCVQPILFILANVSLDIVTLFRSDLPLPILNFLRSHQM
jgi:Sec1 family